MNYIGSKATLLPFLEKVYRRVSDGRERTFFDIFAGTGAVGRHFKRLGMRVIANDFQHYAYVLNRAYIEFNTQPEFRALRRAYGREIARHRVPTSSRVQHVLAFINDLPGESGFISRHYGPEGNRLYYTPENASKADAIRLAIERWRRDGLITEKEYYYVLCSLLEAIDRVANTASVYGAYLKRFKSSATRPLRLRQLDLVNHVRGCKVFREDANELISKVESDVLYIDPPYNHRQYGANYHVLETIATYDDPAVKGITGMREYKRSRYCQSKAATAAFEHLIRSAHARHILVSYNDEGLMSLDQVRRILGLRGTPKTFETAYTRFKADNGRQYKRTGTVEYVHYVRVTRKARAEV